MRSHPLLPALVLSLSPLAAQADTPAPAQVKLFDGATLAGWEGTPGMWRVEDGAITGQIAAGAELKRNEWIYAADGVDDFDLTLEYKISGGPSANSGIQIRSQRDKNGVASGYQADLDAGAEWLGRIYDEHGRALIMERGTRVSIAPDGRRWADPFADPASFQSVPKADEWNTYRIRAAGPHIEVWVNGVFFGALDDHESGQAEYSGRLAFQLHSGPGPAKVQFRNIQLTRLGKTAVPGAATAAAKPEAPVVESFPAKGADGKELNVGFEKGNLEDWTAEGDAWADQPIKGDTVKARKPGQSSRHAGEFWLGCYEPKATDAGTGRLTSAAFEVTHPWASFLVGGGGEVAATRVEIVNAEDGKVFHTAAGRFEEDMHREIVDMRPLQGKKAFVRIIDRSKEGWGHINFDDFVFHAGPPVREAVPGGRVTESPVLWHLRPNPLASKTGDAESRQVADGMLLVDGFQAEVIASEPDIIQPIAFCMDARGRLWVLEGLSYPNKQPDGKGRDRVVILEDKDGDGAFETRKIFAEGINLGSGIEVGFGGVYIGAAPELLFYPDRDGDDVPDRAPQTLLDGWGYQDTHETLNSFTWGPDGWLYGCQGVFTKSLVGRPGDPADKRTELRAGVWRYHPVRHDFEMFATGGSNQWGLDYNDAGDMFMTHCRSFYGGGGTTFVIRNGHFWNQANANYAPFISPTGPDFAPDLKNYLPAAAKYDSGEGGAGKPGTTAVYGGHSHVGTLIYQGDNWPDIYRNHLFTHNLHGHQLNHQINVPQGSAYETMHAGYDMLHVPDPRYIAVDLQTGPDGAVYIIDWCDQQHCHTPIEEKWDRSNGRLYRMSWAATFKPVKVDLTKASEADLVAHQTHRNEWYGRTARLILQARAAEGPLKAETVAGLRELAKSANTSTALRGLWALHQTGNLTNDDLAATLQNSAAVIRSWGVRLATEKAGAPAVSGAALAELAKSEPDASVRLALASALPNLPAAEVWAVGEALAARAEDAADRFLPKLIWSGISGAAEQDPNRALALAAGTPLEALADSLRWRAARSAAGRDALTASLTTLPAPVAERAARVAAFSLAAENSLPMPAGWPAAAARLADSADAAVKADAEQLAAVFGDRDVLARMRAVLGNANAPAEARRSAFGILKRTGDPEALPVFAALLDDNAFRSAVIPLLARSDDPETGKKLLAKFPSLRPAERDAALAALTSRPALAKALVSAMEDGSFEKKLLTTLHVRQMRNLNDADINERLEKTWGRFNDSSEASKQTIAHMKKLFSEAPLWAYESAKGKVIFDRVCATCHTIGSAERKLGPDLAGSWRNGIDYFLENIADPNAVIGEDFQLVILTKNDGTVLSGSVEKETDTAVTLRTLTETTTVPKSEIKERQKLEQSLMPPGLLESLPEREALELLKFLTTKPGE